MKAYKLLAVLFAFLLFIILPAPALADDNDFEVDYEVWPGQLGPLGGNVRITLEVTNTGPANITSVTCTVNTVAGYSERWTGTITPGSNPTIVFMAAFSSDDVAKDRILQVSMNNDSDANPDGIKMYSFRVGRLSPVISMSASISPGKPVYRPGETVTITHYYKNNSGTHAVLNLESRISMSGESVMLYDGPAEDVGDIFPGDTKTVSFRYTFADDAGDVRVSYRLAYKFMDRNYSVDEQSLAFRVELPVPRFTVSLTADPTVIDAGDRVKFDIRYTNTSEYNTDFVVYNSDKVEMASLDSAPPGFEGFAILRIPVDETSDIFYIVSGTIGEETASKETNTVHITVRETATPLPPSPSVTVMAGTASPTPDTQMSLGPSPFVTAAGSAVSASPAPTEQPAVAPASPQDTGMLIYILIAAVLLLAGAITFLAVRLGRKKKQ